MEEKKVGRKEKFATAQLQNILDSYFSNNKVFGQVTSTQIAEYAEKELGYKGIKYYHFNRNKDIKSIIDDTNNIYTTGPLSPHQTFISFNSDAFLNTYRNDFKSQKIVLRQFSTRYEQLNRKLLDLENINIKNEAKILNLENSSKDLTKKLKEEKLRNKKLTDSIKKLNKFKNLNNKIVLLEYLKDKGLVNSLDEDNLLTLLSNCKISSSNDLISSSEFDEFYITDNLDASEDSISLDSCTKNDSEVVDIEKYKSSKNTTSINEAFDILNNKLKK